MKPLRKNPRATDVQTIAQASLREDEKASPELLRLAAREGRYVGFTAGLARGFAQANICILPKDWADEFSLFSQRNPLACPILHRSEPGDPHLATLGRGIDVRTDIPRYHVYANGQLARVAVDIEDVWQDDLVTFALGCSFSFEEAMQDAGLTLPYLDKGQTAGIYETNIPAISAGRFSSHLMVTMRPFAPKSAIRAIQVTSRFPKAHGAPIHIGFPEQIGVNLLTPYLGIGSTSVAPGELPLFWACGLTAQLALQAAKPPLSITHAPSSMLVTDIKNAALAVF